MRTQKLSASLVIGKVSAPVCKLAYIKPINYFHRVCAFTVSHMYCVGTYYCIYLIHISAVGTIALHAIRTWPTLYTLRCLHTLRSWVAGVGHTGGTRLHPSHPWGKRRSTRSFGPLFPHCYCSMQDSVVLMSASWNILFNCWTHHRLHTPSQCSSGILPLLSGKHKDSNDIHSSLTLSKWV